MSYFMRPPVGRQEVGGGDVVAGERREGWRGRWGWGGKSLPPPPPPWFILTAGAQPPPPLQLYDASPRVVRSWIKFAIWTFFLGGGGCIRSVLGFVFVFRRRGKVIKEITFQNKFKGLTCNIGTARASGAHWKDTNVLIFQFLSGVISPAIFSCQK